MADNKVADLARRHRLSESAVQALVDALTAGRGIGAQWSHPELGGMGQWSGGMLQIGDMFNDQLKARVSAVLSDLAGRSETHRTGKDAAVSPSTAMPLGRSLDRWWPAELGDPASSGAQNAMRYACFPDKRRLAVEQDGRVTIYDTADHQLTGFSQRQSHDQSLAFRGPDGPIELGALKVIAQH